MIFYDTETIGFHGLAILIQYAKDKGEVKLHEVFTQPICNTLKLIEEMMEEDLVGFNLAFDHFHLCKLYTVLSLLPHDENPENIPEEMFIEAEKEGRDGPCLRPKSACDLFLHSRKTELQECMERSPVILRKVPLELAFSLCEYLNVHLRFEDYLFEKKKEGSRWKVELMKDKKGDIIHPDFRNVVCRFAPSGSLKSIAKHVLHEDPVMFDEIGIAKCYQPLELGYAPYAKAVIDLKKWPFTKVPKKFDLPYRGTWPLFLTEHKLHWKMKAPRGYAVNDVILTRKLYDYFGKPDLGDIHSELACHSAAVRWKGYALDLPQLKSLRDEAQEGIVQKYIKPRSAQKYITRAMDAIELMLYEDLGGGTSKEVLHELTKWTGVCSCENGCDKCPKHPVAERAEFIIENRKQAKKVELYNKLLLAERFHASHNIIGTKSGRSSGKDGLNSTGIDRTKKVRRCFTFGSPLSGGDFNAFEVSIAESVYKDKKMTEALLSNKKIHAIFGSYLFSRTYQEILESEGSDNDLYGPSKSGFFALMYGGEAYTLHKRLGVEIRQAELAVRMFLAEYPEVARQREKLQQAFTCVENSKWRDPQTEVESLFGFKRYFNLEFEACRFFFDLIGNMPKHWHVEGYCNRGDRPQSYTAAVCSALFSAIYTIQGDVIRAAGNHRIQSTGADITKRVEYSIIDLQPKGIHPFEVQAMDVHDELIAVSNDPKKVEEAVLAKVDELKAVVPLLSISWKQGDNWAEIH